MLKTLIKCKLSEFFTSILRTKKGGKPSKLSVAGKAVLTTILLLYLAVIFLGLFGFVFYQIGTTTLALDLEWLYYSLAMTIAFVFIFVFSVFTTASQLFTAKDNELLLSMPIRPRDILLSRIAVLLITDYMYEAMVILPCFVVRCILAPVNVSSIIVFFVMALTLPLFSLSISCLFAWILSSISSRLKNKNIFTVFFSLCFLAAYFFFYSKAMSAIENFQLYAENTAEALRKAGPVYWIGNAIAYNRIPFVIICLALFIIPAFIVFYLLRRSFIGIATRKVSATAKDFKFNSAKSNSQSKALIKRELQRFTQSSTYMLNSGLGLVFLVAAGVFAIVKADTFRTFSNDEQFGFLFPVLLCLGVCFISSTCTMNSCTISLEGKTFWIVRSLPVSTLDILYSKLKFHCILVLPTTLFCSFCICIAQGFGIALSLTFITATLSFGVLSAYIGLFENLRHPILDWTNETVPVKQGMSVLFTMLIQMGLCVTAGIIYFVLAGLAEALFNVLPFNALYLAAQTLIFVLFSALLNAYIKEGGKKRFEKLY